MHQIQKKLLCRLSVKNDQKYAELTRGYDFENNIVFHLKKLLKEKLIEKDNNIYKITPKGIKIIHELGLPDFDNPMKKTLFVGFVAGDHKNFLLKGHPAAKINFYNLPSGRPRFGENMEEAIARLFEENTGLKLEAKRFEFLTLHIKIVKTPGGEVMFDDGQVIYRVEIAEDEREKMKLNKSLEWKSESEIKKLPNCWPEVEMCILSEKVIPYANYEIVSEYKL